MMVMILELRKLGIQFKLLMLVLLSELLRVMLPGMRLIQLMMQMLLELRLVIMILV